VEQFTLQNLRRAIRGSKGRCIFRLQSFTFKLLYRRRKIRRVTTPTFSFEDFNPVRALPKSFRRKLVFNSQPHPLGIERQSKETLHRLACRSTESVRDSSLP